MIFRRSFSVPASEGFLDRAIAIMVEEFGLVAAHGYDPSTKQRSRVLVWEDDLGIGRFRVHCYAAGEVLRKMPEHDTFIFGYWVNKRAKREVFEKDPMRPVIERVYSKAIAPVESPHMLVEKTIDELLCLD